MRYLLMVIVIVCCSSVLADGPEVRTWTSATGALAIEAVLMEKKADGTVVLKRTDGKRFEIKPDKLSAADQEYIRQWVPAAAAAQGAEVPQATEAANKSGSSLSPEEATAVAKIKLSQATAAVKDYEQAEQKRMETSTAKEKESREKIAGLLEVAMKEAAGAGNLDDAIAIRNAIKELQHSQEAAPNWTFKSAKANEAARKYLAARKTIELSQEEERKQNRAVLIAKLEDAVKVATKAQNLDDALAIRATIKALRQPGEGAKVSAEDAKRSPHALAPANVKTVAFLDYKNSTWANDISGGVKISPAAEGYQVDFDVKGGYQHKLIVFPKEDLRAKKMIASFEIKRGELGLSLRPRDMSPRGAEMDFVFEAGKRYTMEVWFTGTTPRCLINGKPAAIQNRPDCFGYFGFKTDPRLSVVFYDLRFVGKNPPAAGARER